MSEQKIPALSMPVKEFCGHAEARKTLSPLVPNPIRNMGVSVEIVA